MDKRIKTLRELSRVVNRAVYRAKKLYGEKWAKGVDPTIFIVDEEENYYVIKSVGQTSLMVETTFVLEKEKEVPNGKV